MARDKLLVYRPAMLAQGADEETGDVILDVLSGVFDCAVELSRHIRGRGRVRNYTSGKHLVENGDPVQCLFVIVFGTAQAVLFSFEGQAVLLHEYRRGDFFGAMGSPLSVKHEADVIAVSETSCFLLDSRELAVLAEQHGRIGLALLRTLVDRLQRTEARMYEHAALSSLGRVHAELLRQAKQAPDLTIRPAPVLAELAFRVSTTRETVSRAVNALERRGIIRRDHNALTIVAPHRLEELIL